MSLPEEIERVEGISVPTFIFNQHQWSLYAWTKAFEEGSLNKKSRLLHVDAHPDLVLKLLFKREMSSSLVERIIEFGGIDCESFIAPAIMKDFFSEIDWVYPDFEYDQKLAEPFHLPSFIAILPGKRHLMSLMHKNGPLWVDRFYGLASLLSAPLRKINPRQFKIFDLNLMAAEHLNGKGYDAVDIDMDYFSAGRDIYHENIIEPLALASGINVEELRRHYLSKLAERQKPDIKTVESRIEYLLSVMQKRAIRPAILTIAQSDHDNFTEKIHVEYIKDALISGFRALYG